MHPVIENGMGVPAFLAKLWRLVEDSETNNLISWGNDGRSFIIQNQAKFAKELLPLNYKHNNMASFIRQLNMYGFHKITSIDNGGLKFDKDEMEFSHPYFQKGHPYLLEHIKRKIANTKAVEVEKPGTKTETVSRVLTEVKNMRGRQESLDTRFSAMKQENEALWREVAILRQKHIKQQQIVNKLIQFLVTIVQPQRSGLNTGIGKRRGQLMINDAPQTKLRKSTQGPVIRELTEDLLDDLDSDLEDIPDIAQPNIQSPASQSSGGSNSFDQDYLPSSHIPASITDYMANNYGNNYYVADNNGSAGSIDLGLDDIDEIDTNSMAIYNDAPAAKKEVRGGKRTQNVSKQDSANTNSMNVADARRSPQIPNKSLLIAPNKDANEASSLIDADLMLNVFDEQLTDNSAGTSGLLDNKVEAQNTLFDDVSQPPSDLLDDNLFGLDVKKPADNNQVVTKYNPKHTDILRLNSVDDYSSHLNNVQNDLDSLKDLLSGDCSGYQLDANQLLGNQNVAPAYLPQSSFDADTLNKLFGGDEIEGYEMSPSNMDMFTDKDENTGAGNRTYQSSSPYNNNLDLNELLQGDLCGEQIDALQN